MASIYKAKSGKYKIAYYPLPHVRRIVTACTDYKATEALARKLEADAMLRREGVIDARTDQYAKGEAKPLLVKDAEGKIVGGHLAEHHAALLAKGVTVEHAELVRSRVAKVLLLCKADRISTITASAVQTAIGAIRQSGLSLQTCNDTLQAVKQFSRWLWRDGRAREHVLAHLTGYNVKLDRRHDRRAMTDDELVCLIQAAERGPVILGMSGADRAMLCRLALGTGFRANELRSLTPESFDLDADPPTITVSAAYSKRRRCDEQPIRPDLADLLRPWLTGRPAGVRVFNMPDRKSAKMMRVDLRTARQNWIDQAQTAQERKTREGSSFCAYRDSAGLVADFHALRHSYVSRLVQSGASVKVAQELARHSTPMLTLGRYAHVGLVDRMKALDALPTIEPIGPSTAESAKATGTYPDGLASPAAPGAARRIARGGDLRLSGANTCEDREGRNARPEYEKTPAKTGENEHALSPANTASGGNRTRNHRFTKAVLYH